MLRIKFTYLDILNQSSTLNGEYYFSTEPLDYNNIYWEPRITDFFEIEDFFNVELDTSNRIRTMSLNLDNNDKFFNKFMTKTTSLLNNLMTLYYDNAGVSKTFTGKIQSVDSMGSTVRLTLRELGYEYLENTFPDAQIAYDYYSQNGINESWNCIPIHFGHVNRIPLSWVNSFYSEYIIGSGPIMRVTKVYIDEEVIYDYEDNTIEYQPSTDSLPIKVRIFKGVGYDSPGHEERITDQSRPETIDSMREIISGDNVIHISQWGGFAYIQLYSTDKNGYEIPAYPYNKDGQIGQVYVDIDGIVSVTSDGQGGYIYGNTAITNPARIIKMLFCNPQLVSQGPCAIGWNYPESQTDFQQAITDCDTIGLRIDGSFDTGGQFSESLKKILYCCRGFIVEENGKITLKIDKEKPTSNLPIFDEEGIYGFDCNLEEWKEPDIDSQTNRVRLNYDWSQEFKKYNKKPDANHESPDYTTEKNYDLYLQDSNHALKIQKWNTEEIELKFVSDMATAHKLAIYYLRKKTLQHVTGKLSCSNEHAQSLNAGDLIEVRSKQFDWYGETQSHGKLFQITSISHGGELTNMEFVEYDPAIFEMDSYTQFTPKPIPEKIESKQKPQIPKTMVLRTTQSKSSDSTSICGISGTLEYAENSNKLFTTIRYADCGTTLPVPPDDQLEWIDYGNIDGDTFNITGLSAGHYYKVKVFTVNNNGVSETLTSSVIQANGDATPPQAPNFLLTTYLKSVIAEIVLQNPPIDLAGFELWRSDNTDELDHGVKVGTCASSADGTGRITDDTVPGYNHPYYYSVRAYDAWGNKSPYTSPKVSATCSKITPDDIGDDVPSAAPYAVITIPEINALFEQS